MSMSRPSSNATAQRQHSGQRSRVGKRLLGGFFEPSVRRRLRLLAAQLDKTQQELLLEALTDLFGKHELRAARVGRVSAP